MIREDKGECDERLSQLRTFGSERWTRLDVPGAAGRLIRELSWDKLDGRGLEDVLTTEIFQCLSFLPPEPFLTSVFKSIHDLDNAGVGALVARAASSRFLTLPGDFSYSADDSAAKVQPDVIIAMDSIVVSVEAKRLRSSLFDATQLARQAVLLSNLSQAEGYIWVVLGTPPPIKLGKFGSHTLREALIHGLEKIVDPVTAAKCASQFSGKLGWCTWEEIVAACRAEHNQLPEASLALAACTDRIIGAMEDALRWHR